MRDAALKGLAVGFFDGVHLGHQAILKGADAALTFRSHPLSVLAPEKAPRLIMSCEERVAAIKACGVKDVTVLEFTRELAEMSAEKFAREWFLATEGRKGAQRIFCGGNWRFGKGGEGDAEWLRAKGIDVVVAPYVEYKSARISSSRIRACLEQGEIEDANAMMGRKFEVVGTVEKGKGLGTKLGYPTLNLSLDNSNSQLQLPHGVYAVEVAGQKAIANYGLAPTLGDRAWPTPLFEVHFLSPPATTTSTCSYTLSLLRFLRPERKFPSLDALRRQIAEDISRLSPLASDAPTLI